MLSDVEEGDNLMLTKLTPVATLVIRVYSHFCDQLTAPLNSPEQGFLRFEFEDR